jgi:uridine kinase
VEERARQYRRHRYELRGVEVVLLEGIFLFKRELRRHFGVAGWVDCSFETAMSRAILRSQEGLSPEETCRAFEEIYWPAQRLQFERDQPRETADLILNNKAAARR